MQMHEISAEGGKGSTANSGMSAAIVSYSGLRWTKQRDKMEREMVITDSQTAERSENMHTDVKMSLDVQ